MRAGVHPNEPKTSSVAPQEGLRREGRIAVCHIASGDRWAGAEAQLANLLTALARRAEFQLSLILLNEGQLAEEARASGVEVKVFPESRMSFARILSQAAKFLKGKGIQVLHSHRYKENLLAALLGWRCRIPFLVRTQHGLPERFPGFRGFKHALMQRVDRWVARNVTDCIVSVSEEQRGRLISYLDPQKVVTLHNGIDTEGVRSVLSRKEAKLNLGIAEDTLLVGTAGRLEPIKRLDIFLAAAKQIVSQVSTVKFLLAGGGSEEARLRRLTQTLGLHDQVFFLGHREDIYDVLRALDIFVLSSDHEGLPMVLLEALYLGTPVVARAVGGISEVIQNDVTGVLVKSSAPDELAKACTALLPDEALRQHFSEAGRATITERFTAAGASARVVQLYQSLVAGGC